MHGFPRTAPHALLIKAHRYFKNSLSLDRKVASIWILFDGQVIPPRTVETIAIMKKNDGSLLQVYHAGQITVVGFGGRTVNSRIDFGAYHGLLLELVRRYECRVLAVDLSGVKLAPAGMLGVLVPLRKLVHKIEIHNPSESARETLSTIHRPSLFEICDSIA